MWKRAAAITKNNLETCPLWGAVFCFQGNQAGTRESTPRFCWLNLFVPSVYDRVHTCQCSVKQNSKRQLWSSHLHCLKFSCDFWLSAERSVSLRGPPLHDANLLSQPRLPLSTAQSLCSGPAAPDPGYHRGSFKTMQMSGLYPGNSGFIGRTWGFKHFSRWLELTARIKDHCSNPRRFWKLLCASFWGSSILLETFSISSPASFGQLHPLNSSRPLGPLSMPQSFPYSTPSFLVECPLSHLNTCKGCLCPCYITSGSWHSFLSLSPMRED